MLQITPAQAPRIAAPVAPPVAPTPAAPTTPAPHAGNPLPELGPLELRVTFDRDAAKGASFLDLHPTQLDTEPWGNQKSFTTMAAARKAAFALSGMRSTAVAIVSGQMDRSWDPKHNKPNFFITPLDLVRRGHVNADGTTGGFTGPQGLEFPDHLPLDVKLDGVQTRDLSEIRYVMWNESVQAIVDGATELRRGTGAVPWTSTLFGTGG